MASPPFASVSDLAAWVGQDIPADDPRAGAVLSAASSVVKAHVGADVTDAWTAVPDDVSVVVVQAAARVWLNPEGLVAESVDDYSRRWESSDGGIFLTKSETDLLSPYRVKPKGLWTLGLTRGDLNDTDQYLEVTGSEPIPFLPDGA